MKYNDKRIYQIEKEIKEAFLILIVFILAFTFGFFVREPEVKEMQTKIENLEEVFSDYDVTLYRLEKRNAK